MVMLARIIFTSRHATERRKNYLFAINQNGQTFNKEEAKAGIVFSYYNEQLGTKFPRMHHIDLSLLELLQLELAEQAAPFSADEIASIVLATPSNRAPSPDGFLGTFYKAAWDIVGSNMVRVFQVLWDMDFSSFHALNETVMVLLHKTQAPMGLKDYRPINLIHFIGKLFSKGLAMR
jgi:hypothetical protein